MALKPTTKYIYPVTNRKREWGSWIDVWSCNGHHDDSDSSYIGLIKQVISNADGNPLILKDLSIHHTNKPGLYSTYTRKRRGHKIEH